jgi:hypothetical protein
MADPKKHGSRMHAVSIFIQIQKSWEFPLHARKLRTT